MTSERTRVLTLLDELQAAERAGAMALGEWAASCRDPALRGGLRVIQARGRRHAALAEQRLRALGGTPAAAVGRALAALCEVIGDPGIADRSKLAMLLARAPAAGRPPLGAALARLTGDAETRALFVSIDEDEQASLGWLRSIQDLLEREGT